MEKEKLLLSTKQSWLFKIGVFLVILGVIGLISYVYVLEGQTYTKTATLIISLIITLVGGIAWWSGWFSPFLKQSTKDRHQMQSKGLLTDAEKKLLQRHPAYFRGIAFSFIGGIILVFGLLLLQSEQIEIGTTLAIVAVGLMVVGSVLSMYGVWEVNKVILLIFLAIVFILVSIVPIVYSVSLFNDNQFVYSTISILIGLFALASGVFLIWAAYKSTRKTYRMYKDMYNKGMEMNSEKNR